MYYLFYYSIAQNKHYEQKPVVEISRNIKVAKFFAYTLEVKYINKEVGDNRMPIKNFTIKGIGFVYKKAGLDDMTIIIDKESINKVVNN